MNQNICWIGVDWGITHLRCYALNDEGNLLDSASSKDGINKIKDAKFEEALLTVIDPWLESGKVTPVLACGMVGSRNGWLETPFQKTPCRPCDYEQFVRITCNDSRIKIYVIPGVANLKQIDLMRGEETQLAGLLCDIDSAIVCLPGTHSKWVQIKDGRIEKFSTFISGELFDLMSNKSMIRYSVNKDGWDNNAFTEGVLSGFKTPELLSNNFFKLRADDLMHNIDHAVLRSKLSGLIIGLELAGAKDYLKEQNVQLIGEPVLNNLYSIALSLLKVETSAHNASQITLSGLKYGFNSMQKYLGSEQKGDNG